MIAKALHLEHGERRHALRALGWLIAATAAVHVFSYATLTRLIKRISAGRSARTAITTAECATAIRRASRLWPARCLPQAIAGYCLLRRGGHAATVRLGVAVEHRRLDAHAWLECDDVIVTGGDVDRHYVPLPAAGGPRRQ